MTDVTGVDWVTDVTGLDWVTDVTGLDWVTDVTGLEPVGSACVPSGEVEQPVKTRAAARAAACRPKRRTPVRQDWRDTPINTSLITTSRP